MGGKLFVDNVLEFSVQLGIDYSAEWTDASVFTITALATHPNFLGYDEDPEVSLSNARCRWGDVEGEETVPAVLESMRVQCPSHLHDSAGSRTLQLSLNQEDYTTLTPMYVFYEEPRLAVFTDQLQPAGGVQTGGTVVTVHGSGFDVMPDAGTTFVRCRWGSIYAAGNDTAALLVNATIIICPSAPLPEGLQNLSIALNGQQFFATNLQLLVYPQPSDFSLAALNTSDLGLGPEKYFGKLVGAPLGVSADVWVRGVGFQAFQNSSTAVEDLQLRCRWGESSSAPITTPTRVENDLVICPAAVGGVSGDVGLFIALNAQDFVDSGVLMRYYSQPTVFTRSLEEVAHCATSFDHRCATGLHPTGGRSEGGTSATIYGEGFAAFRLQPELASCQWGAEISIPAAIEDTRIICPTPPQAAAAPSSSIAPLSIALNGVHFADTGHVFRYYVQPVNFSSIEPTGGALASRTSVTIEGEGFLVFSNSSAKVRCRWGTDTNGTLEESVRASNGTSHETDAVELTETHVVCPAHPKDNAGSRTLYLSLNSVDFGTTGLSYKYYKQVAGVQMEPTGGLVTGGTPVTFSGHGFDAFFGRLNDTLCRWGNETFSSPQSLTGATLICHSAALPAGVVPVCVTRILSCACISTNAWIRHRLRLHATEFGLLESRLFCV